MKHFFSTALMLLGFSATFPAGAFGRLADIAVVDQATGQRLEVYYQRGEYWVAGTPGAHYAIAVANHLGERVLAVTSVDGINVITGQTAGLDQSGYVLDPWGSYQITGWRKSDAEVALFAFTAAPRSYASRTDRPENVGVIGVALFREHFANPAVADGQERREAAAAAPSPSEPSSNDVTTKPMARTPQLGTAHGEREYSYAAHTLFLRRHPQPDEIIRIRYDSLANLVAMGVVRPPHHWVHPGPTPFPNSDTRGYVPDPPPFEDDPPR